MNQTAIMLPASCSVVAEEEMMYLDGGAQVVPSTASLTAGIASSVANFCGAFWDALKGLGRSFVEITLDDLRNPNFQAAVLTVSILAVASCLLGAGGTNK